jgi:hypothetical protein
MSLFSHTKEYISSSTADEYLKIIEKDMKWTRLACSPNSRLWKGENISMGGII